MLNQRQYSLPNCVLTLEGMSTQASSTPVMDIVTRCQFEFVGYDQAILGGREFLEALIQALNPVIQTWLSGVKPLKHWFTLPSDNTVSQIHVQAQTPDPHSFLILIPRKLLLQDAPTQPNSQDFLELKLSTVQMFDLIEALDQLCLDALTLPELKLSLASLHRRDVAPTVTLAEQATPIGLGALSLALAAAIFFIVPVPTLPPEPDPATPQPTLTPNP